MENILWIDENIGFTTRLGGVSTGPYTSFNQGFHVGDEKEVVLKNRQILADTIGLPLGQFVFAAQCHSDNFHKVTKSDLGKGTCDFEGGIENCDALYTFEKNVVLGAFYADCTPVYFKSQKDDLIGVIHAGWQGTAKGITEKTLAHILEVEGVSKENIALYIGPSIKADAFQVQEDLLAHFKDPRYESCITYKNGGTYFDVPKANVIQLKTLGFKDNQIKVSPQCTYKEEKFFSFRRDNVTGRMAAVIVRK